MTKFEEKIKKSYYLFTKDGNKYKIINVLKTFLG